MVGMKVAGFFVLTVLVGLCRSDFNDPVSRQKRFSTQSCQMTPDNTIEKVIDKNGGVKFACNLDGTVQVLF
jgi:hypothetical protein